jgi:predicted CxxxxCH...CXXCH cytochrome family protein
MKNHHEVGHFKTRLSVILLSLAMTALLAGQSMAATACTTCHGMPPLDNVSGQRDPVTGSFQGSHQTHVRASAVAADCVKCHANTNYDNKHAATAGYKIAMSSNINSSATTATYSKAAPFDQSPTPAMGTCSSVNCHFEAITPAWGSSAAATNCSSCHSNLPSSGSHTKHANAYGGTASCTQCHPSYGTTNFSHATSAGKHKIVTSTFLTYSGGTATSWLPSQPDQFGSCRATLCHDTGRDNPRTPVWGTSKAACTACHALAPATLAHTKHLSGLAAGFNRNAACGDCHKGYVQGTTATADHLDGNVDVYYITSGDLGYTANKSKGSAVSSCSTSYCHSNGRSGYTPVSWSATSTGCTFCHPSLAGKHGAHINVATLATASYASTADNSAGTTYNFGCANCHPTAVSNHLNGTIDITLNSTHGGPLKSKNSVSNDTTGYTQTIGSSVTCAASYCHSNGMATPTFYGNTFDWYEGAYAGDKCARCHGNSPNTGGRVGSTAHAIHTVGIHSDDIYNGKSRKLPISGAASVNAAHGRNNRSTTINCNICHAATVTSSANDKNTSCSGCHNGSTAPLFNPGNLIADASKHVNGQVDISFINQKISTKAQVATSAFAAYTGAASGGWARNANGMPFKTYTSSYDVTKATLSTTASWSAVSGCLNVACHANKTVKWTDTISCVDCHTRLK